MLPEKTELEKEMTLLNSKTVFLGLGSNIEPRLFYLNSAVEKIRKLENVTSVTCSRIYETKPIGNSTSDYLNMAMKISVNKTEPDEFLKKINLIEASLGRIRKEKWGDRTIDIDILFWGNEKISNADLSVPHPELVNRLFVLDPLMDLDSEWIHPVEKKTISELRNLCLKMDQSYISEIGHR